MNWTLYGKQLWSWYRDNLGTSASSKHLPRWVFSLNTRQLQILFDAMVLGDGHADPREGCSGGAFYSTSKQLCEDFQEIAIRLGLRCIVRVHKPAEGNRKTRYRALFSRGRDHSVQPTRASMTEVPYRGKVYCCAVDTGMIVTERNGCIAYQGNTGEHCYTIFTVGGYVRGDDGFQIVYSKRFDGPLVEPELQMAEIYRLIEKFRIKYVGADYGMGFHPNKLLTAKYGPKRIHQFQYASRAPAKVIFKPQLFRYLLFRTPLMSDVFSAIKNMKIRFPAWDVYKEPFAKDILSIRSEYSDTMKMIRYDKPKTIPDDTFHSVLYTLLASMLDRPRPDIIAPLKDRTQHDARRDYLEALAIENAGAENFY